MIHFATFNHRKSGAPSLFFHLQHDLVQAEAQPVAADEVVIDALAHTVEARAHAFAMQMAVHASVHTVLLH